MPFGLIISFACHAALLMWALVTMRAVDKLPIEETPTISAEIITPSEFLRLKQGAEDAKKLETKAKEEPKPDESKNDTKKPEDKPPPPPPPQETAKLEDPPPPEPPKAAEPPPPPEPPKPPEAQKEPDPIAKKIDEPPPPPEPTPGPSPDEQKILQQKIEEEAKKKAEEEAKKKAEEEAKKKAEELKKKKAEEERRKKLAEARKKAEEEKKKFDASKIADLLNKSPDDAEKQKALLDKDPRKKGQQASGTSQTAEVTGKEAGVANGHDVVLSAREQDLLAGMIKSQLKPCSKMPGAGGGGSGVPVVTVQFKLNQDGSLDGEPVVIDPQDSPIFKIAAQASINAVKNCSPMRLPADKYGAWKSVTTDFDWPQMLGMP